MYITLGFVKSRHSCSLKPFVNGIQRKIPTDRLHFSAKKEISLDPALTHPERIQSLNRTLLHKVSAWKPSPPTIHLNGLPNEHERWNMLACSIPYSPDAKKQFLREMSYFEDPAHPARPEFLIGYRQYIPKHLGLTPEQQSVKEVSTRSGLPNVWIILRPLYEGDAVMPDAYSIVYIDSNRNRIYDYALKSRYRAEWSPEAVQDCTEETLELLYRRCGEWQDEQASKRIALEANPPLSRKA